MSHLSSLYPFQSIRAAIQDYAFPQGAFDPHGSWNTVFALHTSNTGPRSAGRVEIEKRTCAEGGALLRLQIEKTIGPPLKHVQKTTAEMKCASDALSTPSRWTFDTRVATQKGEIVAGAQLQGLLEASGDAIHVEKSGYRRSLPRPKVYTVNWALFDAAQRLPHGHFEPLRFTLFDDFDMAKPDQTLSFRETLRLNENGELDKGGAITLHGYSHTGTALEPWTYWVDDAGRLLFAVSGTILYLRLGEA